MLARLSAPEPATNHPTMSQLEHFTVASGSNLTNYIARSLLDRAVSAPGYTIE